jgi:peptidoglycan/LPS O-acetylase OafA/YrhL
MTMVIAVSLVFSVVHPIPLPQILAATFYYTNYYKIIMVPPTTPLDPMWSLAVEEHYYLLFPIIFSATWKFKNNFLRGLIIAAARSGSVNSATLFIFGTLRSCFFGSTFSPPLIWKAVHRFIEYRDRLGAGLRILLSHREIFP